LYEALFFAEHGENMLCTKIVLNVRNNFCTQHVLPRFELAIIMHWTRNIMNNLSSYCGLVDAKIRASDKDLPVCISCFLASCRYQHSTNMVVCATWNTSLILLLYRQYIEGHWPHNSCLMWGFVGYCFLISCHQVNSPWRSTKYFFFSSCSLDRHCQSSPSFLYIAITQEN